MYLHFMGVNLLRMRNEQYITIKVTPGVLEGPGNSLGP